MLLLEIPPFLHSTLYSPTFSYLSNGSFPCSLSPATPKYRDRPRIGLCHFPLAIPPILQASSFILRSRYAICTSNLKASQGPKPPPIPRSIHGRINTSKQYVPTHQKASFSIYYYFMFPVFVQDTSNPSAAQAHHRHPLSIYEPPLPPVLQQMGQRKERLEF